MNNQYTTIVRPIVKNAYAVGCTKDNPAVIIIEKIRSAYASISSGNQRTMYLSHLERRSSFIVSMGPVKIYIKI